ncbi:MAG: hypothetical protein HY751_06135 [Nitrospinae bacterium]|nr:hypothetical protein [Nitrospinota bacterium]
MMRGLYIDGAPPVRGFILLAATMGIIVVFSGVSYAETKPGASVDTPISRITEGSAEISESGAVASGEGNSALSWKEIIHLSLFPDNAEPDTYRLWQKNFTHMTSVTSSMNDVGMDPSGRPVSLEEQSAFESWARAETYVALSRMMLYLRPVVMVKEFLDPLSNPISLYEKEGQVSTVYFAKSASGASSSGDRIFGMKLWVSPANSINMSLEFYDNARLSFLDGNVVDFRLSQPNGLTFAGARSEGGQRYLFIMGIGF